MENSEFTAHDAGRRERTNGLNCSVRRADHGMFVRETALSMWISMGRWGLGRDCEVDIAKLKELKRAGGLDGLKREFVECLDRLNLYHMLHSLPIRIDEFNNVVNQFHDELVNRENVLVIENIAPVDQREKEIDCSGSRPSTSFPSSRSVSISNETCI